MSEPMDWVDGAGPEGLERLAAQRLETLLPMDRHAGLSLLEQVGYRQVEVGSLAVRCLSYLDQFEPFITTLNQADQKSHWSAQIGALEDALDRGPETAAKLRRIFEKLRPEDAIALYRQTWGYTQAQLDSGSAAQLIAWLDHEDLDMRVLAIENLKQITGTSLYYRPELPPARRQKEVKRWRERLESGRIQYPVLAEPAEEPTEEPAPAGTSSSSPAGSSGAAVPLAPAISPAPAGGPSAGEPSDSAEEAPAEEDPDAPSPDEAFLDRVFPDGAAGSGPAKDVRAPSRAGASPAPDSGDVTPPAAGGAARRSGTAVPPR